MPLWPFIIFWRWRAKCYFQIEKHNECFYLFEVAEEPVEPEKAPAVDMLQVPGKASKGAL